jgi:hypothetical protein
MGLVDKLPVVFPFPPLTPQLNGSVEECTLENGEECSLECSLENGEECSLAHGEECNLINGEPKDSGHVSPEFALAPEFPSTGNDPIPAHRPMHHRWYYTPVSSDPVLAHAPSKRQSKPPQRLTSSKLGQVVSRPLKPVGRELEFLGHPANKKSISRFPSRTKKVLLLVPAPVVIPANEGATHSIFDAGFVSAPVNRFPGSFEICALCSDKQEATESSGTTGSETNEAESQQNDLGEADSGPSIPRVPLVLSAFPRHDFSGGNDHRTGRFVIQLTFPGGELPDQPLEVVVPARPQWFDCCSLHPWNSHSLPCSGSGIPIASLPLGTFPR